MIQIENLNKTYQNGSISVQALKNVNLTIGKGEFVGIMGPSGSGKSTFMNVLGCLDRASSGVYILDGKAIKDISDNELAEIRNEKIGFVFQSFNLLPRTSAYKNVELPMIYNKLSRQERHRRTIEALKWVGLEGRMDHKPNELSGGQRQRVAIARALVNQPAIILADEPTGNLDSKSGDEVMEIFKKLNRDGATIVLVTHEPEIAQQTKRIVTFRDGEIVSDQMVEKVL
ncbi:ABC transporter ATP-binding protein [Alkaliphilus crotonatoxidans]